MEHRQTSAIAAFQCLGDACPDTCCRSWSMQLDARTLARYEVKAPELMDAVEVHPVPEGSVLPAAIMRRDPVTDVCVKLESGWCGIHRERGSEFLGDACHFYPRVLRRFGEEVGMTATLSCPEAARLMLASEFAHPLAMEPTQLERLPYAMRDYAPDGVSADDARQVQQMFLDAVADAGTPKQAILQLHAAALSLEGFAPAQWITSAPMALRFAATRIPNPEPYPADVLNLLLALCGLMQAAGKSKHPRLLPIVERITQLLSGELSWHPLHIEPSNATGARLAALPVRMEILEWVGPFLMRWLQAQLSLASFPYSGFGVKLSDRASILGVRMATLSLALLARDATEGLTEASAIEEAQILARFMDHLAEPEYSMNIYSETGWVRAARLRALLEQLGLR